MMSGVQVEREKTRKGKCEGPIRPVLRIGEQVNPSMLSHSLFLLPLKLGKKSSPQILPFIAFILFLPVAPQTEKKEDRSLE